MFPKFHRLGWLKSRTFWQVALSLIFITALSAIGKGITIDSNSFNNSLTNPDRTPNPVEKK